MQPQYLFIISLCSRATVSHVKLKGGHKAASKTAPHYSTFVIFIRGKCFSVTAPETQMNALYVDDVPCGTVIKTYKCFSVP